MIASHTPVMALDCQLAKTTGKSLKNMIVLGISTMFDYEFSSFTVDRRRNLEYKP